jgi:hypothetical protein
MVKMAPKVAKDGARWKISQSEPMVPRLASSIRSKSSSFRGLCRRCSHLYWLRQVPTAATPAAREAVDRMARVAGKLT